MKHPLLRILTLALMMLALAGCATTERPRGTAQMPAPATINGRDPLQRVQDQIYDAATGPNHVGSTYTR